jgi:hypothetical protein
MTTQFQPKNSSGRPQPQKYAKLMTKQMLTLNPTSHNRVYTRFDHTNKPRIHSERYTKVSATEAFAPS